jgi:outer membrane protein assembly complex protein YaeT
MSARSELRFRRRRRAFSPHRAYSHLVAVPLLAGLWVVMSAITAWAQPGTPIVDVRVEEEGAIVTDPAILSLIETRVGEPLSMWDVRMSQTHLNLLDRVLEVYTEPVDGGTRVIYRLNPAHPIDRLEFEGDLRTSAGSLRSAVLERFGSAPIPVGRLDAVLDLLRTSYADRGYPDARIEALPLAERHQPEHRSTLRVHIDAGPRAIIREIVWNDEDPSVAAGAYSGQPDLRAERPYDLQEIRRALQRWVEEMRGRRYYEAFAEEPETQFTPEGAIVRVALRRGPRVTVRFTGDPLTRSEQERLVPVREEASVAEDLLENWSLAIESYLRSRGYRDAMAPHTSSPPGAPELTITFDVMRGPRYMVGDVSFVGQQARPVSELREEFVVQAGDPYVEAVVDAGAVTIEEVYRTRGFTRVAVTPAATPVEAEQPDDAVRRVNVVVNVAEGPRTLIRNVAFTGNTVLGDAQLRALTTIRDGDPLAAGAVADSVAAVTLEYRNRGYEDVTVTPLVERLDDDAGADVTLAVVEGTQVFVDRIVVQGNVRTSRDTIERELEVQEGFPLGYSARLESQARLSELGLFRRVRILDRPHEVDPRRDLLVQVDEALPTTLGYGGGLEISSRLRPAGDGVAEERIEFVPRGFFEIGRRNMWGKNRSVNLFTRVSARARDTFEDGVLDSSYGINEYRVYGTFREPRLLGTAADVVVTGIAERAIRTSYSFVTREARGELGGRLSEDYTGLVRFSVGRTRLFDVDPNLSPEEQPLIDRLFPQVRLSRFAGTLIRNTRNDDLDPSRGMFISMDGEVAARAVGSEVGYVKTFLQGSWYRQMPATRRIVLAVRAALGAAHGFTREVPVLDSDGNPAVNPDGFVQTQLIQDLPASERFFAGGSTTNRGFSTDRLGNEDTITASGFPTGGNGEILVNSELRVGLFGGLAGVVFFDAGNVFQRAGDLSLMDLRPAAGFGFHYRWRAVGPVRAEMGFNLDRRELSPGRLERGNVLHISLGPAF